MQSSNVIHVTIRLSKNSIHPTNNQPVNPEDILFPVRFLKSLIIHIFSLCKQMSTILAARYHPGKSQATVMRGGRVARRAKESRKNIREETDPRNVFATVLDKSVKQIVSQNSGESVNNPTRVDNATKIDQCSRSSIQVR
jgi:hypothetical protein